MIKKFLTAVIVGAVAKVVIDKLTESSTREADLWAEATDDVGTAG
jgi:hypothetical protein